MPEYKSNFPFVPGVFCEREALNPLDMIVNFTIALQPEEVQAIVDETKFLWVYGYIAFRDFLGSRHEQRWCAKWQAYAPQPDGSLAAVGFVYDSVTPAEYTKRT